MPKKTLKEIAVTRFKLSECPSEHPTHTMRPMILACIMLVKNPSDRRADLHLEIGVT